MGAATKKRSPLKRKPLRSPGQSLEEETQRLIDDSAMPPIVVASTMVVFAGYEWWRSFVSLPPRPWLVTLLALAAIGYAAFHSIKVRRRLGALRLGLAGEKVVGQLLETLRTQGCQVFHDIPGEGFNVDHVVVGPQGVFAIETKTFSKPARGESKVTYDGDKMAVNGREPDRNPLVQARACRDWLSDLLLETTAKRFKVRGVVLLPGWWVEPPKERPDVWVLNPKALAAFVGHEPIVLRDDEVALASSALAYHVTRG